MTCLVTVSPSFTNLIQQILFVKLRICVQAGQLKNDTPIQSILINFLILIIALQWQTKFFVWRKILSSFIKVCVATLACGGLIVAVKFMIAIFWPQKTFVSSIMELIFGAAFGLAAFVIVCFLLKCPEMLAIWGGIKRRLIKSQIKDVPPEIVN